MERQEQLRKMQELQREYKLLTSPTAEQDREFEQAFQQCLSELQAEQKRQPQKKRQDETPTIDNTLAEVLARSAREHEQEEKELQEAIDASRMGTGWGGGWRLGGAEESSAERAALDRKAMQEQRGRLPKLPAGKAMQEQRGRLPKLPAGAASSAPRAAAAASSAPSAPEDPDLQAAIAASLKSHEQDAAARFNKEEQELHEDWRVNQAINARLLASDAAVQSSFDKVGKLVVMGGMNSRYDNMQAVVLEYDRNDNQFLVQMNHRPAGTDGKLWVDPGQLFEQFGAKSV
jgi:hypothetical protein